MNIKNLLTVLAATVLVASPAIVRADAIPYPNIGTAAPTNSFVATADGDITAYFYGSDAGFDSTISMLINGFDTGLSGLPNHSSAQGASVVIGHALAGDVVTFELIVSTAPGYFWYSDPTFNSDGLNHVYSTDFSASGNIPKGLFIGFEDLPGLGDVDYNDHEFVVTNVTNLNSRSVPDASSTFALGLLAIAGLGFMRRRLKA